MDEGINGTMERAAILGSSPTFDKERASTGAKL
jgi:hypothetical protein